MYVGERRQVASDAYQEEDHEVEANVCDAFAYKEGMEVDT